MTVAQKDRDEKHQTLCRKLYERQHHHCPMCRLPIGAYDWTDIHHARCHRTLMAMRRWPHCVEHEDNLMLVHHDCHLRRGSFGRWSERQLDEWEAQLAATAGRD